MRTVRALALLAALLALPRPAAAQFTIPNNDASGIAGNPQSIWMQADVDAIVAGVAGSGVIYGTAVTAQVSPNMTVAVAAGTVKVAGVFANVTAGNVTIPAASVSNPRIDLIVSNNAGTKSDVQGTAAANPGAPAIPASSVLLAMVYIPTSATSITTARIVDKRAFVQAGSGGTPFEVNLLDYGAKCDGATNDAAAIQAAVDAIATNTATARSGTIVWPAGNCFATSTITVADTAGHNVVSISIRGTFNASKLTWNGATNIPAVTMKLNKYFRVQGLQIINNVAKGTTTGLLMSGWGTGGTETLGGVFDHVRVDGFHIDMQAGAAGGIAASDTFYSYMELNDADTGWLNVDGNSLNHVFTDLNIGANTTGLSAATGTVFVRGGSSANNTTDFEVDGAVVFSVRDFRAEVKLAGTFVHTNGTSAIVLIDSCDSDGDTGATSYAVLIDGASAVTIRDSWLNNRVTYNGATSGLFALTMTDTTVRGDTVVPIFINTSARGAVITFRGNRIMSSGALYRDVQGEIVLNAKGSTIAPIVRYGITQQNFKGTTSDAGFAQLNRIRMLAYGSEVDGRNLRLEETFATSATKAVTFKRTISVTRVNDFTFSFAAGAFSPADIGRKVTIADASVVGEIDAVNNGTNQATIWTNDGSFFSTAGAHNAVVGEDEPDAQYLLTLGCSAQETFSWSAKSTTGFTLTSSNASSTATCDVLVVR